MAGEDLVRTTLAGSSLVLTTPVPLPLLHAAVAAMAMASAYTAGGVGTHAPGRIMARGPAGISFVGLGSRPSSKASRPGCGRH
ncbi:hypothetical protein ABZP36_021084 [Zizania latifolia]